MQNTEFCGDQNPELGFVPTEKDLKLLAKSYAELEYEFWSMNEVLGYFGSRDLWERRYFSNASPQSSRRHRFCEHRSMLRFQISKELDLLFWMRLRN